MPSTTPWPLCLLLILLGIVLTLGHVADARGAGDVLTAPAAAAEAPERLIELGADRPADGAIGQRLRQILAAVDGLAHVDVRVEGGVVTLDGEVASQALVMRARRFASQIDGVVAVESRLAVDRSLERRLVVGRQSLQGMFGSLAASLPLLALSGLILVLAWWLGRRLSQRQTLLRRITPNPFLAIFAGQLLHIAIVVGGIFVVLVLFDATALIGTLLGAAGILGLALGFAVRDTVENYIASLLLSLRNPFAVNDFVAIDGHEGHVVRLTSRATVLLSPDGNHVRIPNATVFKSVIVNYTRHAERRFEFDIGVDTDLDLRPTLKLATDTLSTVPGVLVEPPPVVVVDALGDSNVQLRAYGWVDQTRVSFIKVRSEAIRALKAAFDEAGIVMPEPVYQLRMVGAPAAAGTLAAPPTARPTPSPSASAGETPDVSADRSIEEKVVEELGDASEENLLSPRTAREF
ncbi:MAG: mechanosensitive ion channel [Rhodocyclaceae bacterium]|nr:mechanosensitive ion channel [Rhodocyclaceae bacterium]